MKLKTKIKRFEALREWVRKEPRRYCQQAWLQRGTDIVYRQGPPCGTAACLAGGMVLLQGYKPLSASGSFETCISPSNKHVDIRSTAARLLGLVGQEINLFAAYGQGWHRGPREAYNIALNVTGDEGIQARAAAAIAELDIRIAAMRRRLKREGNVEVGHAQ